jgi:hypothetical protein
MSETVKESLGQLNILLLLIPQDLPTGLNPWIPEFLGFSRRTWHEHEHEMNGEDKSRNMIVARFDDT